MREFTLCKLENKNLNPGLAVNVWLFGLPPLSLILSCRVKSIKYGVPWGWLLSKVASENWRKDVDYTGQ